MGVTNVLQKSKIDRKNLSIFKNYLIFLEQKCLQRMAFWTFVTLYTVTKLYCLP